MANIFEIAQDDPERARKRLNQIRNRAYRDGFRDGIISTLGKDDFALICGFGDGELIEKIAKTPANIYVLEADSGAFGILENLYTKNENFELVNAAASVDAKRKILMRGKNYDQSDFQTMGETTVIPNCKGYEPSDIEVECVDVIDKIQNVLTTRDRIEFLSLDIKGMEFEVLKALFENDLLSKINTAIIQIYPHLRLELREAFSAFRFEINSNPEWNIHFVKG